MFSIMLVAITIALDDEETKLSKRRPENPPALDSSSREVNSWVEALRFDRRAGALALHLCGFSKPLWPFFFFGRESIFKTNFHDGFLETNQKPTRKPASEQQKPKPKPRQKLARNWGRFSSFQKPVFKNQFLNQYPGSAIIKFPQNCSLEQL